MNGGATNNHSNLDNWLSEYPRLRKVILDPLRSWLFIQHPPPREDNDEWTRLTSQLDIPDSEKSTGDESQNLWRNPPEEPPF